MIRYVMLAGVGIVFIVMGCFGREFFYAKGIHGISSNKRAPTWIGRTLFVLGGIAILAVSVGHILFAPE
jgi:hypothetical protein